MILLIESPHQSNRHNIVRECSKNRFTNEKKMDDFYQGIVHFVYVQINNKKYNIMFIL